MLGFAQELADDVIVLHEGQVLLHGDLNGLLVQNNYFNSKIYGYQRLVYRIN